MGAGVAVGDVAGGEDFVGEFGAGFEGELFREDESVVAVEEEGGYLLFVSSLSLSRSAKDIGIGRRTLVILAD